MISLISFFQPFVCQVLFGLALVLSNILMLQNFNKALQASRTTLEASIINTASNFVFTVSLGERPLMTSHVFWPFLTHLPTLSYSKGPILRAILNPLPTLISDVINGRSLATNNIVMRKIVFCSESK